MADILPFKMAARPPEEAPRTPPAIDVADWLDREPYREPSLLEELKADWRELVSEVRRSPYSHLIVGIAAVALWTVALILPLVLGWVDTFSRRG